MTGWLSNPMSRRAAAAALLMSVASAGGLLLKPGTRLSDQLPPFELASAVPTRFGGWQEHIGSSHVVNPVGRDALDRLYSQTLSRVYVDGAGNRVMLSVAYGGDQSDATSMHLPEVCYPAQGFLQRASSSAVLKASDRTLPVRRLVMVQGRRIEPLTYWLVVGDRIATGSLGHKKIQIEYALRGLIPDGLILRVSTIGEDTERGFALQQRFLVDLRGALPEPARVRLAGVPDAGEPG
ncbi:MAG TPA: EpsI family protein [Burkholderiaceae bacterium]|nr:EpsI family protein [Burkholderiaceae bacterium]